jgi:two-component system response regulator YesN
VAEDGEDAFEMICNKNPDILITDIRMPGINGIELMNIMMKSDINCKVIMVSGYSDFKYAQQAIRLGVFDYILKPIEER